LLVLLGLDRAVIAADRACAISRLGDRVWGRAAAAEGEAVGGGLDAEADGSAEPWAQETKANVNLKVRSMNLAPLFDLKPQDTLAQNMACRRGSHWPATN